MPCVVTYEDNNKGQKYLIKVLFRVDSLLSQSTNAYFPAVCIQFGCGVSSTSRQKVHKGRASKMQDPVAKQTQFRVLNISFFDNVTPPLGRDRRFG